jgi:uncharacterized protein
MNKCLIIFTRYPEPGTTKTRMIPLLGAEGAAKLQRYLTESTLKKGQQLQQEENYDLQVYFAGGNQQLMRDWLGENIKYISQINGDLGEKMKVAFKNAFNHQISHAILIGTDCPDLDLNILIQADQALGNHDLVLGKATDGGYYLIGLSRFIPQLFDGITWGSELVFKQTKAIAETLELKSFYLTELADLDRPEDLQKSQLTGITSF